MWNYCKNVWLAIIGKTDFSEELATSKKEIASLRRLIENLRETIESKSQKLDELQHAAARQLTAAVEKNEADAKRYAEELRAVEEKYAGLKEDLDETLAELQQAKKSLAHECMSKTLLDKTNDALDELCAAMATGDVEKMMAVVEELDWSNPLSRIAQYHVSLLRTKTMHN